MYIKIIGKILFLKEGNLIHFSMDSISCR